MCIFDIACFHTSMPNTSGKPRDAIITGYARTDGPWEVLPSPLSAARPRMAPRTHGL
jgi:hypothetical protein